MLTIHKQTQRPTERIVNDHFIRFILAIAIDEHGRWFLAVVTLCGRAGQIGTVLWVQAIGIVSR